MPFRCRLPSKSTSLTIQLWVTRERRLFYNEDWSSIGPQNFQNFTASLVVWRHSEFNFFRSKIIQRRCDRKHLRWWRRSLTFFCLVDISKLSSLQSQYLLFSFVWAQILSNTVRSPWDSTLEISRCLIAL